MAELNGTDGNDVLNGIDEHGVAYDWVNGDAGDDTISTTATWQNINPGAGNDTITGGGQVGLWYMDAPGGINANFLTGTVQDGWGGTDRFSGVTGIATSWGAWDDLIIGAPGSQSVTLLGTGNDHVDLGAGLDKVVIRANFVNDIVSIQHQSDDSWLVTYNHPDGGIGTVVLRNTEILKVVDQGWNDVATWELVGGQSLRTDSLDQEAQRTIYTELLPESRFWRVDPIPIFQGVNYDTHGPYYYPAGVLNDSGYFSWIIGHNAIVGDANDDGAQDLVLNIDLEAGHVTHTPLKPILFVNHNGILQRDVTFEDEIQQGRQQIYRTASVDYNNDGAMDFIAGTSGSVTYNDDLTSTKITEPIIAVLSDGQGGWIDATANIAGQEGYSTISSEEFANITEQNIGLGFQHDFSAGDVTGDGFADFYCNWRLYINDGQGGFVSGQSLLPSWYQTFEWTNQNGGYNMSSAIADINGDGHGDLLVWNPDGVAVPGHLYLNDGDGSFRNAEPIPLPVGVYGIGTTKFNSAISGDIDHDGWADVITGQTRSNPYYEGRVVQILHNEYGVLADQTSTRTAIQDPRFGSNDPSLGMGPGEGVLYLVDVNADGHTDIVDTGGSAVDGLPELRILLNDGEGYFVDLDLSHLPIVYAQQLKGDLANAYGLSDSTTQPFVPIDLDGEHGIDWVSSVIVPGNNPSMAIAYVEYSTARYGKAGGGAEGRELGVPGFDEAYYFRHHPEVVSLIETGQYASAVEHYLQVGKDAGYAVFAPYTVVWGSDSGDNLRLQSADETYYGGNGNDIVAGMAGNDIIDGGAGTDTTQYSATFAHYSINRTENGYTVTDNTGVDGTDTLTNIERLQFADKKIALDVTDNALETMQFIGVIAPSLLNDASVRGVILSFFDDNYTLRSLSELAITYDLVPDSNADLAEQIIHNVLSTVTGTDFDALKDACVQYIEGVGQAQFLADVMALSLNIDLIGLQQNGMEYA